MITKEEVQELKTLWTGTLGADCPDDAQFQIWAGIRSVDVIRWAITKAAIKNQKSLLRGANGTKREPMSKPMSTEHRIKYVSSVLIHFDGRPTKGAGKVQESN